MRNGFLYLNLVFIISCSLFNKSPIKKKVHQYLKVSLDVLELKMIPGETKKITIKIPNNVIQPKLECAGKDISSILKIKQPSFFYCDSLSLRQKHFHMLS